MKKAVLKYVLVVACVGCTAKQENQAIETVENPSAPIALEQTVDSVSNTRKDGTQTTLESPLTAKQQLPSALEVYLDQYHSIWHYPTLNSEDIEKVPAEQEGPYYLQADFNKDGEDDFAVQIVESDSAAILAVLNTGDNNWKEYLLEKHPLSKANGKKTSLRYLTLSPQNGISVVMNNSATTYMFDKGTFKKDKIEK